MWAMIDDVFISELMFSPNWFSSCCFVRKSDVQGLPAFPGKKSSFSQIWAPELRRQTDLCWTPLSGKNAGLTLHWAMIARAGGGVVVGGGGGRTSPSPESALRSTHITANVSLWAARCHSFSVEYREGSWTHVNWGRAAERSWTASDFVQIKTEKTERERENQSSVRGLWPVFIWIIADSKAE